MPDVDDGDLLPADPVVDDIRVTSKPKGMYVQAVNNGCAPRQAAEFKDTLLDVGKDRFPIREGAGRVADPHMPWRLSASATMRSSTNSPRSACASPSWIAARVSGSIGNVEASAAAIDRTAIAIASWSSSASSRTFAIAWS